MSKEIDNEPIELEAIEAGGRDDAGTPALMDIDPKARKQSFLGKIGRQKGNGPKGKEQPHEKVPKGEHVDDSSKSKAQNAADKYNLPINPGGAMSPGKGKGRSGPKKKQPPAEAIKGFAKGQVKNFKAGDARVKTKMISAAMIAGGLAAATVQHAGVYRHITDAMIKQGYGKYIKAHGRDRGDFFSKCTSNDACKSVYLPAMQSRLALWLWSLPLLGIIGMSLASRKAEEDLPETRPGFARFATAKDPAMAKYLGPEPGKPDERRGYLGILEDGEMLKPPMYLRCSHAAIMGGPGARKSTGYHKPNMLMDAMEGSSSVVIDLKYPDARGGFFDMAQAFHKLGRKIQVFTPFDKTTMRLNLLETVVDIDSALEMSSMIIPTEQNEGGSAFYKNIERTTLGALLLGVAIGDKPSIREVYRKIVQGPTALKSYIQDHPDAIVRETAAPMMEIKADQLNGIIASLINKLSIFNSAALARATTPFPGQNLDLRQGMREPTFTYIGIQQGKLVAGAGQALLQLVKRTLDQAMFDVAMELNGRLDVHTVFYLDEFANLGPLPNIGTNFATMRSYNVSYQVTLQNRAQGENIYGAIGFKSFFENNLQFQIIFPAFLKMSDAELYSKIMGYTSVIERSHSKSRPSGLFAQGNQSESESVKVSKRELVTPDEMLDWPPDVGIVFPIGVRPIKVFMPRLDESHLKIVDSKGRKRLLENPLHRYYDELNIGKNPQAFLEEFLGSRNISEDEPEVELVPAEDRFKAWAMNLIGYGAQVKAYPTQRRCVIMAEDLPEEIYMPADAQEFIEKMWINIDPTRIKIVTKGAEVLGLTSIFPALCDLEIGGGVRLWINKFHRQLHGHPAADHELLDGDKDPLGFYEEESVTITPEALKTMFPGISDIHSRADDLKLRVKRNGHTYYRIPLRSQKVLAQLMGKATNQSAEEAEETPPKKGAGKPEQTAGKTGQGKEAGKGNSGPKAGTKESGGLSQSKGSTRSDTARAPLGAQPTTKQSQVKQPIDEELPEEELPLEDLPEAELPDEPLPEDDLPDEDLPLMEDIPDEPLPDEDPPGPSSNSNKTKAPAAAAANPKGNQPNKGQQQPGKQEAPGKQAEGRGLQGKPAKAEQKRPEAKKPRGLGLKK